ncbi:translation elongation factor P [Candidatus Phytoplasma oryzae]|uniref:Elongation factor P n=1 Tax=Candidatus Phytoplasma oryzae TaxID=203274 RepID=A0A139JQW5_9MOLU|nr:elongation factor P [Candidatus Phytoplasma oryzae]KXT29377.1 translation elongation factor P [Candidatus Phytoplasma oryzae]RAM57962.1 elongation factor P [Candidatus Phytoplasma oryzae]
MINTNDFKTGQTIKLNDKIYQIIDFMHVKPGKGAPFVRSKLKNLQTGEIIEYIFNAGIKIEAGIIHKIKLKLSYISGESYFFINMTNYEQIEIPRDKIIKILKYLTEETDVEVVYNEKKEIIDVIIPNKISLRIQKTDSFVKNNNFKKNNSFKTAVLETGLVIKVPNFISEGERVIINTITGVYLSRDTGKKED